MRKKRGKKSKTSWLSLFAAISQYRSSVSMPIALRPRFLAATSVVPLPMKGSGRSMWRSDSAEPTFETLREPRDFLPLARLPCVSPVRNIEDLGLIIQLGFSHSM